MCGIDRNLRISAKSTKAHLQPPNTAKTTNNRTEQLRQNDHKNKLTNYQPMSSRDFNQVNNTFSKGRDHTDSKTAKFVTLRPKFTEPAPKEDNKHVFTFDKQ